MRHRPRLRSDEVVMRHLQGWSMLWLVLAAGVPGCAAFERSRPYPVLIRDAETKQPIAAADVMIAYPVARGITAPSGSVARTANDGIAHLHAVAAADTAIVLEASAPGYLTGWQDLSVDEVRKVEPAHFLE